jgi:hypothetical protein
MLQLPTCVAVKVWDPPAVMVAVAGLTLGAAGGGGGGGPARTVTAVLALPINTPEELNWLQLMNMAFVRVAGRNGAV